MNLKTRTADGSTEERLADLRIRIRTALLIGGCRREDIDAQLTELLHLESTLTKAAQGQCT